MEEEEILKVVRLLIGKTNATGSHGVDMDERVPNVDKLGNLVADLFRELQDLTSSFEDRPEDSIRAVGKKARYWVDFVDSEMLGHEKE